MPKANGPRVCELMDQIVDSEGRPFSPEVFADRAGLGATTVRKARKGESLRMDSLVSLARHLGVEVAEIIALSPTPSNENPRLRAMLGRWRATCVRCFPPGHDMASEKNARHSIWEVNLDAIAGNEITGTGKLVEPPENEVFGLRGRLDEDRLSIDGDRDRVVCDGIIHGFRALLLFVNDYDNITFSGSYVVYHPKPRLVLPGLITMSRLNNVGIDR